MVWTGDSRDRLAGSLLALWGQLTAAYPDRAWQDSPLTGTIGDAAHRAEAAASDHNPWLNSTVRALDVAAGVDGGPDCEALFEMCTSMYGARDPRVYPYGYAIFRGRITDWDHPGGVHPQQGDPHNTHLHISVGRTGYDDSRPWPLPIPKEDDLVSALNDDEQRRLLAKVDTLYSAVIDALLPAVARLDAQRAATAAALAAAQKDGADLAAIAAAAEQGAAAAVDGLKLTISRGGQ